MSGSEVDQDDLKEQLEDLRKAAKETKDEARKQKIATVCKSLPAF